MPEDDTIGQIIRRDLDRLPMLPAERWMPPQAQQNERRRLWTASAVGLARTLSIGLAVAVVAVAAGLGLADWRAQRAALDESQAAGPPIPGPLNLAGGAPSLGFGLVSTSANTLLVRNEITEGAALTFSGVLPQVAVSPNGHDIAYWLPVPDRQTGQAIYELNRFDLLDPAVRARVLMRGPAGDSPGPPIWSSDGTGLIANTHTAPTRGSDAGGASPATHATWFKIDVATAKTEQLPQTFADSFNVVYAWDRSRDLVTGSMVSFGSPLVAGGPTFLTFKGGVIQRHAVPMGGLIAAADLYAKSVVIAYAGGCKGPPADSTLRCPLLEMRDQATFGIVTGSSPVEATSDFPDVVFRPRSQDLMVQFPLKNGDARVELWSDLGRGPHQVLATYTQLVRGTIRFTSRRELMLPRIDGSAVFLLKFDRSSGGRWFGEVVGLYPIKGATGFERTPFEILTGGNPLASVVLDPAFARAMDPRLSAAPPSVPTPRATAAPWPAHSTAEVARNLPSDPNYAPTLAVLTRGVDADPRALGRTTRPATPIEVRALQPSDQNEYLVPLVVDDQVIAIMQVAVDAQGNGQLVATRGWSSSPSFPRYSRLDAQMRAAGAGEMVLQSELVWAPIRGRAGELQPFWRIVLSSGRVVYVFEDGGVAPASD